MHNATCAGKEPNTPIFGERFDIANPEATCHRPKRFTKVWLIKLIYFDQLHNTKVVLKICEVACERWASNRGTRNPNSIRAPIIIGCTLSSESQFCFFDFHYGHWCMCTWQKNRCQDTPVPCCQVQDCALRRSLSCPSFDPPVHGLGTGKGGRGRHLCLEVGWRLSLWSV